MKLKINFILFLFLILIGVVFLQRPIEGLQKNYKAEVENITTEHIIKNLL